VNCLSIESVGVIDEDIRDMTQMWLIACQMYVCNVLKVQLVII
jgi:hypothetical protein